MPRVLLVVNPQASGVSDAAADAVAAALGPGVEIARTERQGHAVDLVRDADAGAVVVFGGDGVFNEALNGLRPGLPLGLVPGGGSSVLPRALGLSSDVEDAARRIADAIRIDRTSEVSLGRVNGRRFTFAAGVGADAELVRNIDRRGRADDGRLPGDMTVAWLLTRQFASRRGKYDPSLHIEGLGRAAFALVANGDAYTYVGPLALRFAPEARFELGLDVVAPTQVRARSLPSFAWRGLTGRVHHEGTLYAHDLDRITIYCDRPMPLQADGEDLGDVREAHFESERDAAKVLR